MAAFDDCGLFVNDDSDEVKGLELSSVDAHFCVDVSGSTSGSILRYEKESARELSRLLNVKQIIGWQSYAKVVRSIDDLRSSGGTDPTWLVNLVKGAGCVVVWTDGQIHERTMEDFKWRVERAMTDTPIIVIFALHDINISIERMQRRYINMSIPEAFLSLSNNVLILVVGNDKEHRLLMSKGCFTCAHIPQPALNPEMEIQKLPSYDLGLLSDIHVPTSLPSNMIRLDGYERPLNLDVLYRMNSVPLPILKALNNRMLLPRLNLDRMQAMLIRMNQRISENPRLAEIRKRLSEIAISDSAGSDEHKSLIAEYNEERAKKDMGSSKEVRTALHDFLSLIAAYRLDTTSICLGSNRANRATVFDIQDLDDRGVCAKVECPIMMDTDDACVLIKAPEQSNFIEEFTSDYAMESPFHFGTWLVDLVTPGILGHTFAKDCDENPYTRERVMGFLPLSEDPKVVLKHMSKLFGGNRELWHMVRGYISMMAHVCEKKWIDEKIVIPHLAKLFQNYRATVDLKGGSEKVPLDQAFENVLKNYNVCLRDRSPGDVRAIVHIVETVLPNIEFDKVRVEGMINVIETFSRLLKLHKKGEDMLTHVMNVDDYQHHVEHIKGINGLVAQIFWRDFNGVYKKLKLQMALDKALTDKRFKKELKKAFVGKGIDDAKLRIALPEPKGSHFGMPGKFENWNENGINELRCVHCGREFKTVKDKLIHLKKEFGAHFYNGHLCVKHAIGELGVTASEKDLFINAKKRLFQKYGVHAGYLHTKRCKNILIHFIQKFKNVLLFPEV